MSDEEFLKSIEALLQIGSGATEQQIESNAYEFIKAQKQHLPNKFLTHNNTDKKAIFMACAQSERLLVYQAYPILELLRIGQRGSAIRFG